LLGFYQCSKLYIVKETTHCGVRKTQSVIVHKTVVEYVCLNVRRWMKVTGYRELLSWLTFCRITVTKHCFPHYVSHSLQLNRKVLSAPTSDAKMQGIFRHQVHIALYYTVSVSYLMIQWELIFCFSSHRVCAVLSMNMPSTIHIVTFFQYASTALLLIVLVVLTVPGLCAFSQSVFNTDSDIWTPRCWTR